MPDLGDLSIEELSQIEITSVSKRPEPLSEAPAAIYVISGDDIRRSGVTSLPEALRLAPNLEVARISAHDYAISSRGMNSVNAANKLLALIDGRSIYTPFFSSVFWDRQDVMLDDIDRVEVVSGPGGTLWGANAMNGVINVITQDSADTQGALVDAELGDFVRRGAGRFGGRFANGGTYRGYVLGFDVEHTDLPGGQSAMDGWRGRQAGFRTDFARRDDRYTVQGDAFDNRLDFPGGRRTGGNVLGRWSRRLAGDGSLQLQAYYDQVEQIDDAASGGSATERTKTFDVEVEHVFRLGERHRIVWGAGHRMWIDKFVNTTNPFVLVPESETLNLTNFYGQDTIALRDDLKLIVGSKFEYSSFSGWSIMPNVRAGWRVDTRYFLWAAISRAVRTPSRLERDLTAPGIVNASPDFDAEKLVAYEAGWRAQLARNATVSVSIFYDDYSDLRTTSPTPGGLLPVSFGNGWEGHTYGGEAWVRYSPVSWWRLDAGASLLRKDFHLKPGERDIAGVQTVLGHDPCHQLFLRSYIDLPHDMDLYVGLRQIAGLADVGVGSYFEADVRIAWRPTPTLELSLAGSNLVHGAHAEASEPPIHEIPRSVYVAARWSY